MALRPILEYPDPRLRERSNPVEAFDDALGGLIDDLIDTMRATDAVGISAPQIGVRQRVLVILSDDESPEVYVNPVIVDSAKPGFVEESCLSLPGVVGNVFRATRLRVQAYDRFGEVFERTLSMMPAVCLQHELDHLDGRLFSDRLPPWRRLGVWMAGRSRAQSAA
jgi:peptide deformylase